MFHHDRTTTTQNHQFKQITPLIFKFQNEYLYDRNIWKHVTQMNQFNPETQWKFIVDMQITELFDQIPVDTQVLEYLCLKNHRPLIELLIKKDIHKSLYLDYGLSGACEGGHRDLVQMMIDLGATNFNYGLQSACYRGHRDLVQWMIDLGANNWDGGLYYACHGRHRDVAQMMLDHGAIDIRFFNLYFGRYQ